MPKTAGAVRRKMKTPAEERTKLTSRFCKPLCPGGGEVFLVLFRNIDAVTVFDTN